MSQLVTLSLEHLRRDAKKLRKDYKLQDDRALYRVRMHPPRADGEPLKYADFLHVVAQENSFGSWPQLKFAVESQGMDRASKQQRLKIALFHGQNSIVERLLADTPDLAQGVLGLEIALYDVAAVRGALAQDPTAAVRLLGPRRPMLHLAFSRYIHLRPDLADDMLEIAELLVAHGADVDDVMVQPGPSDEHGLSALYGALGHANNMILAQWLLDQGANPNDNESLYHSTELGHHDGLKMLLKHGAKPAGTNALLRAMDFHDLGAVQLLLEAGADPNEFAADPVGGELPWVIPALHQAARRMCDGDMVTLLMNNEADPNRRYQGVTAYAYARVFGNIAVAEAIRANGVDCDLSEVEQHLVSAVDESVEVNALRDVALPDAFKDILRQMAGMPGRVDRVKHLVALGLDFDAPDTEGLTPVQVAGWEGLPEMMGYLLSLDPDLAHVNNFGGDLLSTIVHGSENCPSRQDRKHVACAELALRAGAMMMPRLAEMAGDDEMAEFLGSWTG
ncbi:ankyrin repeat domain-containing protein [Cochlodiniinecator piscidefendens]|uniref:ankyrin repeat domain-containing protein n=1 Tax=Cochlodiniinecator piscidefendens TaxID=2715756 RepID=UPI0014463F70|nr:ankyrin repeat domain-containing protein [Cochlodiniinecator piscidefendens]